MKQKLTEHILGMVLVTLIMAGALIFFNNKALLNANALDKKVEAFSGVPISNVNQPFERALFAECMDIFYPGQHDSNAVITELVLRKKETDLGKSLSASPAAQTFSMHMLVSILLMYVKFLLIYIIVMALTYYAVLTLGSLRFILREQSIKSAAHKASPGTGQRIIRLLFSAIKILAYFILFSPAYVIAYSIRTEFNTDSSFFMILLALISNGMLVIYANKFFTFLTAENRKGYVENALVKNCNADYSFTSSGIPLSSVLKLRKNFGNHLFAQIFSNARFQYLSTIKEQASFLITGLIIIEMALNIHGHLTYELLRQLLYKNAPAVVVIMLLIFYIVKLTEILTDYMIHRERLRYDNR